jgi:hypothetical protein
MWNFCIGLRRVFCIVVSLSVPKSLDCDRSKSLRNLVSTIRTHKVCFFFFLSTFDFVFACQRREFWSILFGYQKLVFVEERSFCHSRFCLFGYFCFEFGFQRLVFACRRMEFWSGVHFVFVWISKLGFCRRMEMLSRVDFVCLDIFVLSLDFKDLFLLVEE